MLLIILYDCIMLVGMTGYTDDSVTTIRDDVVISIVHTGSDGVYIVRWEPYEL